MSYQGASSSSVEQFNLFEAAQAAEPQTLSQPRSKSPNGAKQRRVLKIEKPAPVLSLFDAIEEGRADELFFAIGSNDAPPAQDESQSSNVIPFHTCTHSGASKQPETV